MRTHIVCDKDKLKRMRIERGYTQVQFANAVGVNKSTISFLELGKGQTKADTAKRIINILEIEFDELFEVKYD